MAKLESKYTVSHYISDFFRSKNVKQVFELSGGMIAFLTDAIANFGNIKVISNRHEQASGFAAEGASRINMKPGVALATSGPGATNLITAIGSSYFDSSPVLFLTGQVNQAELRTSKSQRQNGFQELDIVSAVNGFTKYAKQVLNPSEIPMALEEAWQLSIQGRPGPVLIDIPIDVQQMEIQRYKPLKYEACQLNVSISDQIAKLQDLLANANKPLVLAGGGIRTSLSISKFRDFIERTNLPVVTSLMGRDVLSHNDGHFVGFIGSYGNRWANQILFESDLVLALGSRLDVRQTGNSVKAFVENKKIVRIDIDRAELEGRVLADISIQSDLNHFFENFDSSKYRFENENFYANLERLKAQFPPKLEQLSELDLNPDDVLEELSKAFKHVAGYVVDVGQHQMWSAQSIKLSPDQRFLTSGGMGAMGFALPAAIGACLESNLPWVVIAGDGCTQLSIAELQTVYALQLPIAIVVINNSQHGMVAQFQDENMNGRYVATREGYSAPKFVKIAEAFGIPGFAAGSRSELIEHLETINKSDFGPCLLEICISNHAKALPKMSAKSSNE